MTDWHRLRVRNGITILPWNKYPWFANNFQITKEFSTEQVLERSSVSSSDTKAFQSLPPSSSFITPSWVAGEVDGMVFEPSEFVTCRGYVSGRLKQQR